LFFGIVLVKFFSDSYLERAQPEMTPPSQHPATYARGQSGFCQQNQNFILIHPGNQTATNKTQASAQYHQIFHPPLWCCRV
jgi:hypothetical protein